MLTAGVIGLGSGLVLGMDFTVAILVPLHVAVLVVLGVLVAAAQLSLHAAGLDVMALSLGLDLGFVAMGLFGSPSRRLFRTAAPRA